MKSKFGEIDSYSTKNLEELLQKMEISFTNYDILKIAITTRASKNEHSDIIKEDNERLEFLGDSVLKLVLSEKLFNSYSKADEGILTVWRSKIEKKDTLATICKNLDIKSNLCLSQGEKVSKEKHESKLLANCLEAVIGALYLDRGDISGVRDFVDNKIWDIFEQSLDKGNFKDAKTELQELSQAIYKKLPEYREEEISASVQDPFFRVEVYVNNEYFTEASAPSIKEATNLTAKKGLQILYEKIKKQVSSSRTRPL